MRLLIVTQAVDSDDPVLGFFHRWIEEFARQSEHVTVICLREGAHQLPQNVSVRSLGKEKGNGTRFGYALCFYRNLWEVRETYDAVFVHMNPEYVLLAGPLWRYARIPVALWYTHKSVTLRLRLATFLAILLFTASRESFRIQSKKLRIVGHGIDTDYFSLPEAGRDTGLRIMSAGRLAPAKRHDLIIRALALLPPDATLSVAGAPAIEADIPYAASLHALAEALGVAGRVTFLGPVAQEELRAWYARATVFAHASETGSLDKVVLEALATGLPVVSTSEAFQSILEPLGLFLESSDPFELAQRLRKAAALGRDPSAYRDIVVAHHGLARCIRAVLAGYQDAIVRPAR